MFTYGIFVQKEVLTALFGRPPHAIPARIEGYKSYSLEEKPYQTLVRTNENDDIKGLLILDLTNFERKLFSAFESPENDQEEVVATPETMKGQSVQAYTYVQNHLKKQYKPSMQGSHISKKEQSGDIQSFLLFHAAYTASAFDIP